MAGPNIYFREIEATNNPYITLKNAYFCIHIFPHSQKYNYSEILKLVYHVTIKRTIKLQTVQFPFHYLLWNKILNTNFNLSQWWYIRHIYTWCSDPKLVRPTTFGSSVLFTKYIISKSNIGIPFPKMPESVRMQSPLTSATTPAHERRMWRHLCTGMPGIDLPCQVFPPADWPMWIRCFGLTRIKPKIYDLFHCNRLHLIYFI